MYEKVTLKGKFNKFAATIFVFEQPNNLTEH